MRFIAKTGAPNIPIELLEAHENGKLVLFCGAGISYPAGLPGFKGLVENVYNKLGDIADSLEIEAFQKKLFDRVFQHKSLTLLLSLCAI